MGPGRPEGAARKDLPPVSEAAGEGAAGQPCLRQVANPTHQITIAFSAAPDEPRLHCANTACLLALKQAAFGHTRPPDNLAVERDYHDAYLLISAIPDALRVDFAQAERDVRTRAIDATEQLAAGEEATVAAARQMVRLRVARSQRSAEATVKRAAIRASRLFRRPSSGVTRDSCARSWSYGGPETGRRQAPSM